MEPRCGCGSGVAFFGGNCQILFFILVFLILFCNFGRTVVDP